MNRAQSDDPLFWAASTVAGVAVGGGLASPNMFDSRSTDDNPNPRQYHQPLAASTSPFSSLDTNTEERSSAQFDAEIARFRWHLQRAQSEKRELDSANEQLRTQLTLVGGLFIVLLTRHSLVTNMNEYGLKHTYNL